MLDHRGGAQPAGRRDQELERMRDEVEGVDIDLKAPLDAGAQHLDGHAPPGRAHGGGMHLRDGGGGDGRLDLREQRVDRRAELGLDAGARGLHREGRQLVLQHPQLAGDVAADDVGAGAEDLAEFHIGRAERGQRAGNGRRLRVALQPERRRMRFHQILVAVAVAHDRLAERRYHVEGIAVIGPLQQPGWATG
jgi:hypothetical protein